MCLWMELETVEAPPLTKHNATQVTKRRGNEMLNAVYDVTHSKRDGSGINWKKWVSMNEDNIEGASVGFIVFI